MNTKIMLKKIQIFFFKLLRNLHTDRHLIYYSISSIDLESQTIILHFKHKNIFIKKTFSEIISNAEIVEGLSCQQACWIGIYYGKTLRNAVEGKSHLKKIKKPNYLLRHNYGSYKITCVNRDGTLGCIHAHTGNEINTHPLMIAKDNAFIEQFDANQACYIGILTGIAMEKNEIIPKKKIKKISTTFLRVIK